MKVLAMDQATRCSGYSYFEDGKYIASGVVDLSKSKLDTYERSFEMAKELWAVIKKYRPEFLVIEDVQNQSNTNTVIILSRLQGMLIGYAEAHGVKVNILSPSQWRKILGFTQGPKVKRAELKQQSIDYVKEHYGINVSEDEMEAVAINAAAHKIYNFSDADIWGD